MLELCVREQLRAVSYDAGVAGSAVALGSSTSGFELSAYGYSQRLETLLDTMLDNVRRPAPHAPCTPLATPSAPPYHPTTTPSPHPPSTLPPPSSTRPPSSFLTPTHPSTLQVLYRLSEKRATDLLTAASGRAKLPIVSVPKFLELFTAAAEAAAGGAAGGKEPIKPNKVDRLSGREQKLLLTMRDYLFEQHSRMQNMFRRCDPDGNGYVTIEEFLNAMSRAGLPVGHGLDRQSNNTISEEEAANIVGFFDKDGDGHLTYAEFMTMLQATKNSVLTTKVLTQRARE